MGHARTLARWAAPLLVLALTATACGGGDAEPGGTAGGSDPAEPTAAADLGNDINPVAREELTPGGTMTWAINEIPPNFNYYQLDGTLSDNERIISALFPRAYEFEGDGTPVVDEDYFTDIELTSEDPQVITYTINPEATWSDGRPVDWTDIQAQATASNGEDEAFLVSSTTGYDRIASVEMGEDDRQAVVTFSEVFSDWQSLFTPLYPAQVNADAASFNEGLLTDPGVTAGPFSFDGIDQTALTVTVVRNDDWWGDAALLDSIIFRAIDVDAQSDALANGEIDFQNLGPDLNANERARGIPTVDVRQALAPDYRHMTFNGAEGSILADRELRLAVMKGIDRQPITEALIGQVADDPTPLGNHIFVNGLEGYRDNSGIIAYDPEAAAADLDRLGWVLEEGAEFRTRDGQELVIRDVIPTAVATSAQEAQIAQQQLAAIGVNLMIETVPSDAFFEEYVNVGDFDITHFAWLGTPFPVSSSGSIYGLFDDVQQNYGRIGTPEINDLFDQADRELDPATKIELANEIDTLLWEQGFSLLLYQRPQNWGVTSTLANFGAPGFGSISYEDIGFTEAS